MALTGGAGFVANGKKYLQQPACLAPKSKAVYRVGILVNELSPLVTLTVQLKGSSSGSCCAPSEVINLDVHLEQMETLPVSKSVRVSTTEFQHSQSDSYLFCLEGIERHFLFFLKTRIKVNIYRHNLIFFFDCN